MRNSFFMLLIAAASLVPVFSSCQKESNDLKDYNPIVTESEALKKLDIGKYYFKKIDNNHFNVFINDGKYATTHIACVFEPKASKTQVHFQCGEESFDIISMEKEQKFQVFENDKQTMDIDYDPVKGKFINTLTHTELGTNWIEHSRIDPLKWLIAGAITDEILNVKKIFINPVSAEKEKQDELARKLRTNKLIAGSLNINGPNFIWPCLTNHLCRSRIQYSGSGTIACLNGQSWNTNNCCSDAYCIGCCNHVDCDCFMMLGDYFGWCVSIDKICGPLL